MNRSVAVLDGAVLVIDSVAGVQAQTETVWKAMDDLPCVALVNKMDKDGCNFATAVSSLQRKLPGANPIPIQLPLFRESGTSGLDGIQAFSGDSRGDFCGIVDLVHMRAVVWPANSNIAQVESCVPEVISLHDRASDCVVAEAAHEARHELVEALAEVDETIEELYLTEQDPTVQDLQASLRRITLKRSALPVMASAALRGKGVEPVLDAIADLLPSPLDRPPPKLLNNNETTERQGTPYGHPLNNSLLALAFKVVHMKGRGGSGDGRVVFARVYSGSLQDRSTVHVVSPSDPTPRKERVGGMLELSGGKFGNLENSECRSGEVCALVGLKSVKTGDTIVMATGNKASKKQKLNGISCLAGVEAPKPVLKVRLEAETRQQQDRLTDALGLLAIEDPSLVVEETESATLLSGLGELHIEVTIDRLQREFGLNVLVGTPSVTYRETITDPLCTNGLCNYDSTIGEKRLQAAVDLSLEPASPDAADRLLLTEPRVTVSDEVKDYLNLDADVYDEDLESRCQVFQALVRGCHGALSRGPLGAHGMANMSCHINRIDCEGGLPILQSLPGALRAAVANAVSSTLANGKSSCKVLEPTMGIEITAPNDAVGQILSDLTGSRRGTVSDVVNGEGMKKAMVCGDVPLVSILGYANSLRSLTGGEGNFSAEYKGHSICDHNNI